MKVKKKRKPRGIKLNGNRSYDLCNCCYAYNCDPMTMSSKFSDKINKRLREGKCGACGSPKDNCKCKSE